MAQASSVGTGITRHKRPRPGGGRTLVERTRAIVFLSVVHLAPVVAIVQGTRPADWLVLALLYPMFAFSTGIVLHRYFAHAAFATSRALQFVMGFIACTTFVDPISFAGKHRLHHRFSDRERDVHSPEAGFWFCWFGSLVDEGYSDAELVVAARDLARYPELRWLHEYFVVPGLLLWAVLFAIGGFGMFGIGYCLSIALVVNQTSAVNYFCHRWGYRRFSTRDCSTNNIVVAFLTFGEGWHNNHHRFPRSARAGVTRWEIDVMYGVIRLLKAFRLVRNVVVVGPQQRERSESRMPRSRLLSALLLAATLGMVTAVPAEARQRPTSGDVIGVVRDQLKAVLPDATVTATNVETTIARTVTADGEGRYTLAALPPGTYDISATRAGFARQVHERVTVPLGTVIELDFVLNVAAVSQQVDVVADIPSIDAHGTAVSTVVSKHQIDNLPINRRSFVDFAVLTPGVHRDYTPQTGGAAATSGLTFFGQRARSNNITVDGLDNNDVVVGSVRATFSQEAVREFQVLADAFSAEFGKASGGVLNIVTKSGGNDVAGNVFYFYRDDALNTRNYFEKFNAAGERIDRTKAPFGQQQFGGTLGGPLRRNRTFYFLSLERLKIDTNNFVNIEDREQVPLFGQPIGTPAAILRRAGFPIETGDVPYRVRSTQALGKIDHQIGVNNSLTVRVNWANDLDENIEPWGGLTARSGGALLDSSDFMVAASHTIVPSAKFINELRGQVARRSQDVLSLDPTCNGPCDRDDLGGPGVEIIGFATAGRHRFTPQPRENLRYQVLNTTTYFSGHHELKFGADFSSIDHRRQSLPLHFGGRYIFAPLPAVPGVLPTPLTSIQAFALGLPAAYVQGFGNPRAPLGYSDLSAFAQHDWRPRENLTVKLGLRYQVQFWPKVTTDIPGYGAYTFATDHSDFAPRVAIAWHPATRRTLRFHAAYGIYHDNNLTSLPGINEILDGKEGVRTLVLPFPFSQAAWQAPGHRLPEAAFGASPSVVFAVGPGTVTPYAHHTAVGVNHELPNHVVLAATFVQVRGFNQIAPLEFNPLLPELGPFRRPLDLTDPATGMKIPGSSTSVLQSTSWGQTWYTGLALSASRRFRDDYQLLATYTLGKAEDNSTDYTSAFIPENSGKGRNPNDPAGLPLGFNPDSERGASLQDRRHQLVLSGTYQLPASIQLAGILNLSSGRPYNILAGADLNQDGDGGGFPSDRARVELTDPTTSVPRNAGRLPAQSSVDMRVTRRFMLRRSLSVDAIFEIFNLLNHTNFTEINNIFGVGSYPTQPLPTYGQFEQAGAPRQIQLGIKMNF